jgi:citrate lyase subunit beta/citryl-CoA lyase
MDILRSLLFVPAGRERMLEGAQASKADALVLDLEDAVPLRQKAAARILARRWIPKLASARRRVFVRVNSIASGMTRDDLMSAVGKGLAGIVLPKTESPQDLRDLDVLLREAEMQHGVRPGDIRTIPLIESARGVLRCEEIVRASDRLCGLSVGGEDYTYDIGVQRDAGGVALQHIRGVVVQVAAAYGLTPIDTPYAGYKDEAGLVAETHLAKAIGLKGKYAIHPAQVDVINRIFTPSKDEIEQARRVIEAYEGALARGLGAISVDGRMVDAPVAERARGIIAAAKRRR